MTKDYAKCTTLDEMKAVMKENEVIYKELKPEDKKFYIKLKKLPFEEAAAVVEVVEEVVVSEEDEAKMAKARDEAKQAGAKESSDKWLHLRNGILDSVFKKILDGSFRAKLRSVKKLECATVVDLKNQLQSLIHAAGTGEEKLIIKKYLTELDA